MLIQIAAVRAALDQVARVILEQHLRQSITDAAAAGNPDLALRELNEALDRFIK